MSELITNLNAIYNAKLAIKQAIGTNSDNIEDYATYISEMAPSVSGYSYITGNGTYNIASYEYVNVNVPGEIPPGYTYVYGSYNITGNGSYTVSSYESVNVNVPVPSGYIIPSGTYNITENGTYNISSYENVNVSVSGGGVSLSGDYYMFIPSDGFSASSININSYQPAEVFFQQVSPFVPEDPGMMMYSDYTNINIYSFNNGKDTLLNSSTGWFNNDSIQNTSFTVNSSTDICAYTEKFTYVPGEMDPEMGTETPGEYVSQGETLIQVGSSYGFVLNVPSGEHNVWYSYSGIQGIFVLDNWDVSDDFQVPSV